MSQVFLAPTTLDGGGLPTFETPGLQMTWTVGGVTWDLLSGVSGVRLLRGVRGLSAPPEVHYRDTSPSVPGSRWRGSRTGEREAFWPILVSGGDGAAWVEHDRAWWAGLQPQKTGAWSVTDPFGARRSLTLRFQDDGDGAYSLDPVKARIATYGLTFIAEDPYWRGDPIVRSWTTGTSSDFFNGVSKAPPFNISVGSTIATATLTNPGDVDAWPIWTIYGPSTAAELGLAGRLVTVPFTVASGKALVVDTDPRVQTAYLYDISGGALIDPTERTGDLGTADFAPIPPGASVPLALSLTGAGTIQSRIIPGYYRAW